MTIGRNAPCPCMSGQKFKKCCGITGVWDFFKSQGMNYFDESYILKDLFEKDQVFFNYYQQRRGLVKKPVFYLQSDQLNSAASFGNIESDGYMIATKHKKISIEDSIHIAHELEHLVFWDRGFKYLLTNNQNTRAHKFINDLVYDPLINKILHNYGFNLKSYLELSDQIQMKIKPINEDAILLSTLVVKRFLDYRTLNPVVKFDETMFYKHVQQHYSEALPLSEDILQLFEDTELETPNNTEQIMKDIITVIKRPDVYKQISFI
ncbi:hypothetical protein JMA_27050 [Jeotgalibacillus malaysiensis]|uniref:Zinc chelation protein SecC n=1 Tax=Jeotgalibacillus malaysiensis TaxID=1508404 RepID=A0A0B5ATH4_9BACL|nr:SEC-C metal-binding domain-containing protein [Jeotgalibacillus malaysiensis]AJD92022.1 hypothetical protein JMA_27050 [Jeotgalibacillus malaysiensis]